MASSNDNIYDIVIVGGGTSGLVLASRLSEDLQLQVVVLEAGEDLTADPRILTPAMAQTLWKTSSDWNLKTVPQADMGGREIYVPQGKMLGGSSGMNGLNFTASSKAVVDGWARLGNPGWEWSAFAEALNKTYTVAKTSPSVSHPSRNSGGPLKVAFADTSEDEWPKIWSKTLEALGFPGAQDTLTSQGNGGLVIPDSVDPATAQRSFSANAYLGPARDRANLTVVTGVEVHKVLLEKKPGSDDAVATGVQYTDSNGSVKTVHAQREVILSAGALGSPKLLELSGIGDAGRLSRLGIDTVVDNPGVGENLQNHPLVNMNFEVNETAPPTKDSLVRQEPEALGAAMRAYARQQGPFASSCVVSAAQLPLPGTDTPEGRKDFEVLLSSTKINSSESSFHAAHETFVRSILTSSSDASGYYIFAPACVGFNPDGTGLQPTAGSKESYITIASFLPHPLSRGSVHVVTDAKEEDVNTGSSHYYRLAIDPEFFTNPLDIEVMARHIQFIGQRLTATEPLASYLKLGGKRSEKAPAPGELANLETAKEFLKNKAVGAHHYTGTCSMMPRNMGGVVDPQLRLYGTKNLRVCDASIIPLTPRANPQATVYGVAEHGARLIRTSLAG
ncbi:L-sorbose 1-dehydrogenase [Diaporthe amygdali]|uniref:L-sorbose 1-dehydrogenase n=1 Tax=Phomopsis amygdali TaxID=1214568 RepID=UPI0022FE4EF0|nr:L-sorbose 1-dehydrogenase [Diaporthe amygdali]KAJ0110254.1 L-sorbose 1-dehydrogenase [Diaporthe amygdali]